MPAPAVLAAAAAACKAQKAESDINGIRIADAKSSVKVLAPILKGQEPPTEQDKNQEGADTSFPFVRFATRDGRQELKLFMHYGGDADAYNEVEVAPATASKARRLPFDAFATERGVKLGMQEAALVALLSPCFTRERAEDGATTIKYAIDDENHALLKRAGMPSYYAHYTFRGGRLVRFAFGFEYP